MFLSSCIFHVAVYYLLGSTVHLVKIQAQEIDEFSFEYDTIISTTDNNIGVGHGGDNTGKDAFGYHKITYDTAVLYIENNMNEKVSVWGQSDVCYKCKLLPHLVKVKRGTTEHIHLDTVWAATITIKEESNLTNTLCQEHFHLGELGNYTLIVSLNQHINRSDLDPPVATCELVINKEPRDSNIPMYICLAFYFGLAIVYMLYKVGYKKYREGSLTNAICCTTDDDALLGGDFQTPLGVSTVLDTSSVNNNATMDKKSKRDRLKCLDTCRGIIVVAMMFGNYGGGAYWYSRHEKWNGINPADIVFPWFMFVMGVSVVFSLKSSAKRNTSKRRVLYAIIKRTINLFLLGCLIDGGNVIPYFRIPGVLQRFSICYCVIACLHMFSAHRYLKQSSRIMNKYYAPLCDILDYWYEWLIMTVLMVVFFCITYLLPVPGCPTGYLGPGGPLVGNNGEFTNCTGGAASYIDLLVFGSNHISQHSTPQPVYHTTIQHDPEGILGCLPSILLTFFGLQVGKIISMHQEHKQRLIRFVIWAVLTGGIGTILCKASRNEGWIPLNKNLWSISFILVAASTGFVCLSFFYYIIDVKGWYTGIPCIFPGMNPIVLYVGHEILKKSFFPFSWVPLYGNHAELLLMATLGPSLWVLISYWLYTKDLFFSV